MKLKAAVRYQVTNLLALLLVFSGIIGALLIMGNIVATSSGGVFVASGISTLGFGFIGILAFTTFEGDLRFLLQNGLTRAQVLASCAISFSLVGFLLTTANAVCDAFLSGGAHQSLLVGSNGMRPDAALGFLWTFLAYLAFTAVVFALAALRMRMGKKPFLAAFVIAVLAFLFAPAACEAIFGSVELYWNSIEPFFLQMSAALGYASGGAYPINPIIFSLS